MIDHYSFGHMTINGNEYSKDLIIYPDGRILHSWRRTSGHRLCVDDIGELVETKPDIIIAGTGSPGLMRPDKSLVNHLADAAIKFMALPTHKAVDRFNGLYKEKRIGACFHLTC